MTLTLLEMGIEKEICGLLAQYGITTSHQLLARYTPHPTEFKQHLLSQLKKHSEQITAICNELDEAIQANITPQSASQTAPHQAVKVYRVPTKAKKPYNIVYNNSLSSGIGQLLALNEQQQKIIALQDFPAPAKAILSVIAPYCDSQKLNLNLIEQNQQHWQNIHHFSQFSVNELPTNVSTTLVDLISLQPVSIVQCIRQVLDSALFTSAKPVLIELPIYKWAQTNLTTLQQHLPLPFEHSIGAIAVIVYGYSLSNHNAGGGYFNCGTYIEGRFYSFTLSFGYCAQLNIPIWVLATQADHIQIHNHSLIANKVIELGQHSQTHNPYFLHSTQLNNQHILITGRSGSGKSDINKQICSQLAANKTNCIHIFDLHGEYTHLKPSLQVDVIHKGLPFKLFDNVRNQPIDYAVDNLLTSFIACSTNLGSNQQAQLRQLLKQGFEQHWYNFQLAEAIEASANSSLINQLGVILNLIRTPAKPINLSKCSGIIQHNLLT